MYFFKTPGNPLTCLCAFDACTIDPTLGDIHPDLASGTDGNVVRKQHPIVDHQRGTCTDIDIVEEYDVNVRPAYFYPLVQRGNLRCIHSFAMPEDIGVGQ